WAWLKMRVAGQHGGVRLRTELQSCGSSPLESGIEPELAFVRIASKEHNCMTRQQVLDLYFMENRAKLIDLAAFLDRVDRASGEADFRLDAFKQALRELGGGNPERARKVLLALSDPTTEPIEKAPGKGAVGAWPGTLRT